MGSRVEQVGRVLEAVAGWSRLLAGGPTLPFGSLSLSRSQTDALFLLARAPEPITPGMLASRLGLTPGAVTQLLEGLRAAGLVTQHPHPSDARSHLLSLSASARDQVDVFEQATITRLTDRFTDLSDIELTALADLLTRTRYLP